MTKRIWKIRGCVDSCSGTKIKRRKLLPEDVSTIRKLSYQRIVCRASVWFLDEVVLILDLETIFLLIPLCSGIVDKSELVGNFMNKTGC